jgi:hypothetical protein
MGINSLQRIGSFPSFPALRPSRNSTLILLSQVLTTRKIKLLRKPGNQEKRRGPAEDRIAEALASVPGFLAFLEPFFLKI